ncbi:MAG: site-specific integrase [Anaerolineales bacterium]|nr:MAG: site-specific integrase [Anaerolineales bacterium]
MWERCKEQAGITGDRKTLHSLRHSSISNAARHNVSNAQLKALGSWASIATADAYLHEVNRTKEPPEDLISYDNSV